MNEDGASTFSLLVYVMIKFLIINFLLVLLFLIIKERIKKNILDYL